MISYEDDWRFIFNIPLRQGGYKEIPPDDGVNDGVMPLGSNIESKIVEGNENLYPTKSE
jgi:hypothetical protein